MSQATRNDPPLLGWLRLTGAVEVVEGEDEWLVWVTNGASGKDREGAVIARCRDEGHAELVAYLLRKEQVWNRRRVGE